MNFNLKKLWSDYGIGAIVVLLITAYGISLLANYLTKKSSFGSEGYSNSSSGPSGMVPQYDNDFQKVNYKNSNNGKSTNNPNELLPKTSNSWGSLNPQGGGELENVNLLKAGYHMGIDTVGQSLRNPNYQIRSEPPNPQNNVSPWNQTTITPDKFQVPLELGQGSP